MTSPPLITSRPVETENRFAQHPLWRRELLPDPRGIVGFALVAGVLFFHLTLAAEPRNYLWSENPVLEVLAHAWLIFSPPLAVYLGLRNLLVVRDSILPVFSVPLGAFLSVITGVSLLAALILG